MTKQQDIYLCTLDYDSLSWMPPCPGRNSMYELNAINLVLCDGKLGRDQCKQRKKGILTLIYEENPENADS
jgi:hypothetical protein